MSTVPRGPGSEGRSEETRRRLLDAAAEVFAETGFAKASLEEIARRAGYTRGAFHWHFSTKEELLVAVLRDRLSRRVAATDLVVDAAKDFAAFNREQRSRTTPISAPERSGWALLVLEFWLAAARDPELLAEAAALKADARLAIERQVVELAEASNIELPLPASTLAAALIALEDGFALQELLAPSDVPPTMLWDVIDFMTAAVQQDQSAAPQNKNAPAHNARSRTRTKRIK